MIIRSGYDIFVVVVVMLVGAFFGVLSGSLYSIGRSSIGLLEFVGTVSGAVGGCFVAVLYLWQLRKYEAKGYSTTKIQLLGNLVAVICGFICTVWVHSVLAVFADVSGLANFELSKFLAGLLIGSMIGMIAGAVVGAVCTMIYVLSVGCSES